MRGIGGTSALRGSRALPFAILAALFATTLPTAWVTGSDTALAAPSISPVDNPSVADSCGINVTLVLDASGSIESSNAVGQVRGAATEFLTALKNTDSTARVTQFASYAEELAAPTLVTDAALDPSTGPLGQAVAKYYNPKPPRPPVATIYEYKGSGPTGSNGSWRTRNQDIQYTNWDQGLDNAGATASELVVYITDGEPTAYDLNGDTPDLDPPKADAGPPPDVGMNTNRGDADDVMLDRAIQEANAIKSAGTRVLAVGVGRATGSNALRQRLTLISGPTIVQDNNLGNIDSLNDVDVAVVSDFANLAQFLRSVVLELCSPSLTITKLAQTPEDSTYQPAPGWTIEVEPTVPPDGDSYRWILPDVVGPPPGIKTAVTNANGSAQFQWEPDQAVDSSARITETLQPGYTAGRVANPDYRCEARDEFGNVREVTGDLDQNQTFVLDPIGQEVVTCTLWNSFDYDPQIAVTKVNDPTEVRGDLTPGAPVTSTYAVTNPGNTPLTPIILNDDRCSPVQGVPATAAQPPGAANIGDTNGNGALDPSDAETWQFTCTRSVQAGSPPDPPATIVNTVTAQGTDPAGTSVTATATDDVDVYNPAIEVTKLVDDPATAAAPADQVTVNPGTQVVYSYAVANTGNTPLGSVSLIDDTPPCENPVRGADSPGNGDDTLDVGETWTYSCDLATPTASVINTATVTATPLNPANGNQPFPDPNPPVTATDPAEVDVVNPDIALTKSVTPDVVLLNEAGDPEPVTYTFEATNNGQEPLTRPDGGDPKADNWVVDPKCSPVQYGSGDTNDNDLLDPGETWQFTCGPVLIGAPTVNTATIVGQVPGTGINVTDTAAARVDVLRPGIAVDKLTLRPVVLDPDANAESGPDVPRRPAEYAYTVSNTGNVPLSLDPNPPTDDICSPLVFDSGDTNSDGLLDVDEVWTYTCSQILERQQANVPPFQPGDAFSGLVQNEVVATGVPSLPGGQLVPDKQVTATDTAQTLVIEPGLTLTKTASADVVLAGSDVEYTFVVTNTGDVGLDLVGPQDDKCSPLVFQGGDTNGNGILDGANSAAPESWTYTCTRNLGLPTPPDTVDENRALVAGIDPLGNLYFADATAVVRVFSPAIDLVKTVNYELVPVGTEVTYDFIVTNAGQSPIPADDVLADVVLADASDPAQPSCASPTFVGGDDNGNGLLDRDPAETWNYTCNAVIDEATTNVAAVRGTGGTAFTPPIPVPVFDFAAAFVQPFTPGIDVVKTAEPTELLGSGVVTYTYQVTNTGDVPLAEVAERISDDTCSPVTYVSGDDDNDGLLDTSTSIFEDAADETWVFSCTTTVSETTTNTVTVPGTPTDPGGTPLCGPESGPDGVDEACDVTGTDTETVTATQPGTIVVNKVTDTDLDESFDFTIAGVPFALSSDESTTYENLEPGQYTITESATDGWILDELVCEDATGDTDIDLEAGSAVVQLAQSETVTCTFTNAVAETPIPHRPGPPGLDEPNSPLADTGASGILPMLLASGLLVGAGSLCLGIRRRITED